MSELASVAPPLALETISRPWRSSANPKGVTPFDAFVPAAGPAVAVDGEHVDEVGVLLGDHQLAAVGGELDLGPADARAAQRLGRTGDGREAPAADAQARDRVVAGVEHVDEAGVDGDRGGLVAAARLGVDEHGPAPVQREQRHVVGAGVRRRAASGRRRTARPLPGCPGRRRCRSPPVGTDRADRSEPSRARSNTTSALPPGEFEIA